MKASTANQLTIMSPILSHDRPKAWFIHAHVAWFGFWITLNVDWFGVRPFDPFPFVLLITIVSLEAIILRTFVLVRQNRQAELADPSHQFAGGVRND